MAFVAFSVARPARLSLPATRPRLCRHPPFAPPRRRLHFAHRAHPPTMSTPPAAPAAPVTGLPFVSKSAAGELDALLMSSSVGYTLPQLMELAGQAVAHATHDFRPSARALVLAGPGNNGGDGLVAARHLVHLGHAVSVLQPAGARGRFPSLEWLLEAYGIPSGDVSAASDWETPAVVVDALFGFSFTPRGPGGIGGDYAKAVEFVSGIGCPIVSVDVPSGWSVDEGDRLDAVSVKRPAVVVSLSAPKRCVRDGHENGKFAHYVGGRFVPDGVWRQLGIPPVEYEGASLVRRVA